MTILRITIAAFFVALTVFVAPAMAQNIDPRVLIEPTDHDFGEIPSGERIQMTFEFTNAGNDQLEIIEVRPSCSCTTADWTRDAIGPGESGRITAEVDTGQLIGPQRQVIDVDVRGWNMRTILNTYQLTVHGTVKQSSQ